MTLRKSLPKLLMVVTALSCNPEQALWAQFENDYFYINHPENWHVETNKSGQIIVDNNKGSQAILWPLYLPKQNMSNSVENILGTLAVKTYPGVDWQPIQSLGKDHWRIVGTNENNRYLISITYASGDQGSLAYFYGVMAPLDDYVKQIEDFAHTFESFRIKPAPDNYSSKNPAETYTYVTFTDPIENAFSVSVPQNWQCSGGLFRASSIDTRSAIQLSSPDQEIYIFMGDKNLPYFGVPNETLAMTGFHEGSWYSPGYGNQMMIRRYLPGVIFVEDYVTRGGSGYAGFQIIASNDRPDMVQRIVGIQENYGLGFDQRMDAGEIFYRFNRDRTYEGYTFALTTLLSGYGMALWHVDYLYGYQAPADRVEEAERVLTKVISTTKVNAEWVRMQQNLTANVSSIVNQTNEYISNVITQTFENVQRSQDEVFRKYSNTLLGVEDVHDPVTQETYKIHSGNNYYWIDNLGNITGTNLHQNPDINRFRQMLRLN